MQAYSRYEAQPSCTATPLNAGRMPAASIAMRPRLSCVPYQVSSWVARRVQPAQPCAYPLSGLVKVHHRRGNDRLRDALISGGEPLRGLPNARLHGPRRELQTIQICD